MIKFLKKYAGIDNEFIDDFFKLYDTNVDPNTFSVNLDVVSKWLKVKKFNLMKTLRASYTDGIDFKITKPTIALKGRGRNTMRHVYLTSDCFKALCMMSRSTQANSVRAYYIAVEKALFKYRTHILETMKSRINTLENNQRPMKEDNDDMGTIYIVQASEEIDNLYKLGRTNFWRKRMNSHNSARADNLNVIQTYKTNCTKAVEACAKTMLKAHQYRKYKEVYKANLEMVKQVIEKCRDVCTLVQQFPKRKNKMTGGNDKNGFYIIITRESLNQK